MEQFNYDISLIFAILNGKVSSAINRKLYRNFKTAGLEVTPEQWTILVYLSDQDGVSQQELCNAIYKDKPSMTRLIDNMERQEWVARVMNKQDRRTNHIYLTRYGREVANRTRLIALRTLREALQGLTIEELNVSQEVLRKIFSNAKM